MLNSIFVFRFILIAAFQRIVKGNDPLPLLDILYIEKFYK